MTFVTSRSGWTSLPIGPKYGYTLHRAPYSSPEKGVSLMNILDQDSRQESKQRDAAFVLSLDAIDSTLLPIAGGKAANLGELLHAGFSVPPGFCVTTAAYTRVSAELAPLLAELHVLQSGEAARRAELAAAARRALEEAPVPPVVPDAIPAASLALGNGSGAAPVPAP